MIDVQLFTIMVLMALITTFTTSPIVALIYPPQHRKRFGSRPGIGAATEMEALRAGEAAAVEEGAEGRAVVPPLPVPMGLGLPTMGAEPTVAAPSAAEEEGKVQTPTVHCVGLLRLMLVAQRMTDVPGLALLMELIGPDRVSAVRFVESEEVPLSIIMSQGTLRTGMDGHAAVVVRTHPCRFTHPPPLSFARSDQDGPHAADGPHLRLPGGARHRRAPQGERTDPLMIGVIESSFSSHHSLPYMHNRCATPRTLRASSAGAPSARTAAWCSSPAGSRWV